jgi:hypothetical protein
MRLKLSEVIFKILEVGNEEEVDMLVKIELDDFIIEDHCSQISSKALYLYIEKLRKYASRYWESPNFRLPKNWIKYKLNKCIASKNENKKSLSKFIRRKILDFLENNDFYQLKEFIEYYDFVSFLTEKELTDLLLNTNLILFLLENSYKDESFGYSDYFEILLPLNLPDKLDKLYWAI